MGLKMNLGFYSFGLGLLAGPRFVHWGPKLSGPPARGSPFFQKINWTCKYLFNLAVMKASKIRLQRQKL